MRIFLHAIFSFFLLGLQTLIAQTPDIIINEFMAKNLSIDMEKDYYGFSDWIELYNAGSTQVNLQNYYLSNDKNKPTKWMFPQNTLINPGDYITIWADEMDAFKNSNHTNFKLEGSGGFIGLYSSSGLVVDTVSYPEQSTDVSYGKDATGEWKFYAEPSIGNKNLNVGFINNIRADKPVFSIEGGVYSSSQVISITSPSAASKIHYTLDGSKPLKSSPVFESPINLTSTIAVRAVAFEDGLLPSRTETHTYIINEDISLPVFSVTMNPEYFWDDEIGFYVEGTNGLTGSQTNKGPSPKSNFNQNWRRPVHMEFYDEDHVPAFSIEGEVKVYGGWSRGAVFKSLALYPENSLNYRLFNNKPFTDYNSFILRNSGNDWADIKLRDASIQSLFINQFDVDLQANRPTVLFVNGEFWGVINMREKINEDYMATNHGANKDSVDYIEAYTILKAGDFNHYNALEDFFNKNDLSDSANYEYVKTQMDVKECLNYFIMGIYAGHSDWIYNSNNNLRLWRPRTPDGKWRWLIYDTDASFMSISDNGIEKAVNTSLILRKLLENEEARTYFINTFSTMLNTCLHPEKAVHMLDSLKTLIAHDMIRHVDKWKNKDSSGKKAGWMTPGTDGYIQISDGFMGPSLSSYSQWESNFVNVKTIAQNRPINLLNELRTYFNQGTEVNLNFKVVENNSGIVELDGLKVTEFDGPAKFFIGQTFQVNAAAKHGFQFKEWQILNSDLNTVTLFDKGSNWNYLDNGADIGTSWVSIDFDDSNWKNGAAKFGYGDGNENTTIEYGSNSSDKHVTTYFRKEFTVSNKNTYQSVTMELLCDDGVVVYLNGEEILRDNMPLSNIDFETFALSGIGGTNESTFFSFPIPINKLSEGTNLIAVELHQNSSTSSDLGFDMSISAVVNGGGESSQTISSKSFEYTISESATLTAVFDTIPVENYLFINEIMANNISSHTDENGNYSDWIEIYNNSDTPINVGGMYISNDTANPKLCKITSANPTLTTIPANGFIVFFADKQPQLGPLHLNMTLSKEGGQVCVSEEIAGSIIIHNAIVYPLQLPDYSFGRYSDGAGNINFLHGVTPGKSNIYDVDDVISGIFINEISANNSTTCTDEYGETNDWIEIFNGNNFEINVGGLFISDNDEDPLKYQIPNTDPVQTLIPPKGFLVIWVDGTPEQGVLHLGFKLSAKGETISLAKTTANGLSIIDLQSYETQLPDVSFGRYPDGQTQNQYFSFSTPGTENYASSVSYVDSLFINEFMADNFSSNFDDYGEYEDWVEIYNSNSFSVDIGGLYLTDSLKNLTLTRIPVNNTDLTTIPANGFIILWADKNPEQGALHLDFKLKSSGEQIGLTQIFNNTYNIIDSLTYGNQGTNISQGRVGDGSNNWDLYTTPSPGAPNISTSFTQLSSQSVISVFPNPSNGLVNIKPNGSLDNAISSSIKVYDILGHTVFENAVSLEQLQNGMSIQIDLSACPKGVYTIKLGNYSHLLILE